MNKKNKIIIILSILVVLMLGIVLISNHNKGNGIKTSNDSEEKGMLHVYNKSVRDSLYKQIFVLK